MAAVTSSRFVAVTLDKPRMLRFDYNAIADLQEQAGLSMADMMDESKLGFGTIRSFVWAGLKHEDPTMTTRKAGELIQGYLENGGKIEQLMQKVVKAIMASGCFGNPDKAEAETADPQQAGEA